jgi:hypothetical protein
VAFPSPLLLARLKRNGIVYPYWTAVQARRQKLGLPLACAILMVETGGGHNEFGHDPTIFVGAGTVTEAKYLAYKALRDRTGLCQGAGPCQLTSAGLQDRSDALGGCWKPRYNLAVGFHFLHDLIAEKGLRAGTAAYNGSGAAAERYAEHVLTLAEHFKAQRCGTVIGIL